ncbi:MAG: hypothetical protein R3F30_12425 [Planctomycetota bacterium]
MFSRRDLEALAARRAPGSLSMFLPTHPRGPEQLQDRPRFGNLLDEAEAALAEHGLDKRAVSRTLFPARSLSGDDLFWRHQGEGLAVWASDGFFQCQRLALPVEELVVVGDRFCLRPILPLLQPDRAFHLLALSRNKVRLYEGCGTSLRELDLLDIPGSLNEALGYDYQEKSLQFHGGGGAVTFHGQGRGVDDRKQELGRFFRLVDDGVRRLLEGSHAPVLLAAVDYEAAIYRDVSRLPSLVPELLSGNPDEADPDDLHARALEVLSPRFERERRKALERFRNLAHEDRASSQLAEVVEAGRIGRIDTLFASPRTTSWGRPLERGLDIHAHRQAGDEDLVDLAVSLALGTGASVFDLREQEIPEASEVAAVFRY